MTLFSRSYMISYQCSMVAMSLCCIFVVVMQKTTYQLKFLIARPSNEVLQNCPDHVLESVCIDTQLLHICIWCLVYNCVRLYVHCKHYHPVNIVMQYLPLLRLLRKTSDALCGSLHSWGSCCIPHDVVSFC